MPRSLIVVPLLAFGALCHAADASGLPVPAQRKIDPREVQSLFRTRCFGCHGPQQQLSGLRLDQKERHAGGYSGPVIKPGESGLERARAANRGRTRRSGDASGRAEAHSRRSGQSCERGSIRARNGSISRALQHFNLPVGKRVHIGLSSRYKVQIPRVQQGDWARNPIDAFILARLEREKIAPSPEEPKLTLMRRVSLDLTGLPPSA